MSDVFNWTGRNDPEDGVEAKRWHHVVNSRNDTDSIGIIGFACDLGVERNKGKVGASKAPEILRGALANLAWHGKGNIIDYGTIRTHNEGIDSLNTAQISLGEKVSEIIQKAGKAIVLGGGHETAVGSYLGLEQFKTKRIGILNLDAHFDIRLIGENGISSGTPFTQIREMRIQESQEFHYMVLGISRTGNTKALFDRADEWGVRYIEDKDLTHNSLSVTLKAIDEFLATIDVLYLSLDLDVLPHWQMPAVSAPSGYGVDIGIIERIIERIGTSNINWPLSDVVEFNPTLDTNSCAAKTAARLIDTLARTMLER